MRSLERGRRLLIGVQGKVQYNCRSAQRKRNLAQTDNIVFTSATSDANENGFYAGLAMFGAGCYMTRQCLTFAHPLEEPTFWFWTLGLFGPAFFVLHMVRPWKITIDRSNHRYLLRWGYTFLVRKTTGDMSDFVGVHCRKYARSNMPDQYYIMLYIRHIRFGFRVEQYEDKTFALRRVRSICSELGTPELAKPPYWKDDMLNCST